MFQEGTETLKVKLAVTYEENEKMIEKAKAYDIKEVADPQADDVKENVPASCVFRGTKEASTPPPSRHEAANRGLQSETQPNLTNVSVKRSLFKTETDSGCKLEVHSVHSFQSLP